MVENEYRTIEKDAGINLACKSGDPRAQREHDRKIKEASNKLISQKISLEKERIQVERKIKFSPFKKYIDGKEAVPLRHKPYVYKCVEPGSVPDMIVNHDSEYRAL